MNSNTQQPNLWSRIKTMTEDAMKSSFKMLAAGLPSKMPMPGLTGWKTNNSKVDIVNASKSIRKMRILHGHPEGIGDRRFIRYANKMNKRKNSYQNNLQEIERHKVN